MKGTRGLLEVKFGAERQIPTIHEATGAAGQCSRPFLEPFPFKALHRAAGLGSAARGHMLYFSHCSE